MTRCRVYWFVVTMLLLCSSVRLLAQTPPSPSDTTVVDPATLFQAAPITIRAKSAVLMEASSGQILTALNLDEKIPPASFVKVLTLYVTFDMMRQGKINLQDEVYISQKAWKTGGSKMFVALGTKVPLEELLKGIAVVSGNDACVAVAEHIYGSTEAFVKAMNETAARLGMKNSHFENPHGLPNDAQYTTARDMALLAKHYLNDFPQALQYHSMQEYTYHEIRQYNRNHLLQKDPSVDGLKTGFIEAGGYHLLATARRDERRMIAVVMGAERPAIREEEALKLLNYGFRNFVTLSIFKKNTVLYNLPVWKGKEGMLAILALEEASLTVPEELKTKVTHIVTLPTFLVAPVSKEQEIGRVVMKVDDKVVRSIPLIAQTEVKKAGFFKVLYHSLFLLIRGKTLLFILLGVVFLILILVGINLLNQRRLRRRVRMRI